MPEWKDTVNLPRTDFPMKANLPQNEPKMLAQWEQLHIYDRIRQTSKDEFILEDMVRLGFWPASSPHPHDPVNELQRKNQILSELRSLQTEAWRLQDSRKLREEALKRKLAASRKRREETRARNKAKAEAKAMREANKTRKNAKK